VDTFSWLLAEWQSIETAKVLARDDVAKTCQQRPRRILFAVIDAAVDARAAQDILIRSTPSRQKRQDGISSTIHKQKV
jgi:hypothetical protein